MNTMLTPESSTRLTERSKESARAIQVGIRATQTALRFAAKEFRRKADELDALAANPDLVRSIPENWITEPLDRTPRKRP